MEELLSKITLLINNLTEKHGEAAVATMLETAHWMAVNDIIQSFITLIFGIGLAVMAYTAKIKTEYDFDEVVYYMRKFLGYGWGVIFSMVAFSYIANPIMWKSLTDPKVYVTYQIMKKGLK
jgi:tetrahydromethanopterin S-methyltransferase subunit E